MKFRSAHRLPPKSELVLCMVQKRRMLSQGEAAANGHIATKATNHEGLRLPAHLVHAFQDNQAVAVHALRTALQRSRKNCREPSGLFTPDISSRDFVVVLTSCFRAVHGRAPFDDVEVDFQDPALAKD